MFEIRATHFQMKNDIFPSLNIPRPPCVTCRVEKGSKQQQQKKKGDKEELKLVMLRRRKCGRSWYVHTRGNGWGERTGCEMNLPSYKCIYYCIKRRKKLLLLLLIHPVCVCIVMIKLRWRCARLPPEPPTHKPNSTCREARERESSSPVVGKLRCFLVFFFKLVQNF